MFRFILVPVAAATLCSAAVPLGDSARGAELFQTQKCSVCHSVNGQGGKSGPDLGQSTGRGYTPATMAALMWSHAPRMWEAIERASLKPPKLTTQQAADLYAFFMQPGFLKPGAMPPVERSCSPRRAAPGATRARAAERRM